MAYQGSDGRWYTDEGIPLDQAAEGQPGSYLPGWGGYGNATMSPNTGQPNTSPGQPFMDYQQGAGTDDFWDNPNNQPQQVGGAESPSGGGSTAGDTFDFAPPWAGYGMPAAPFADYSARVRPDYLQGEYKPTPWTEQFNPLTMQQVQGMPGYQTGLNSGVQARERSAASRGTVLSGGTQKALERYGQDYGQNFYGVENGRAYDQYLQRYKQNLDANTQGMQARQVNENAFQNDVTNDQNQYGARYRNYRDTLADTRGAEADYYKRTIFDPTNWRLQAAAGSGA